MEGRIMSDRTVRVSDVRALGDRLFARGRSLFGTATKIEKSDLIFAARCLWLLTADYGPDDGITIPTDDDGSQGK